MKRNSAIIWKESRVIPWLFSLSWEQRKLDDILVQRVEHQTISPDAPLLAFSYAEGVINPEDKKSNKRDFIMTDKFNKVFSRTELNDIIYNPANVIHGAIHRNKLGTGVVSPIYKIFVCNNVSAKYMGERLHTDRFIQEITKYIEGTVVKLRTLSPEMFLDMTIEVPPSYEEQERIGEFFEALDNLITLHQRQGKPSLIDPFLMFQEYTSAWEQRKLGEIAEIVGGGTPSTSNPAYWDGDIDWYAPAEMEGQRYAVGSVRKITDDGLQHSSAKMLPPDKTVLFTSRAGIGKMAILKRPGATNQGFQSMILKESYNPYFIYSMGDEIKAKAEGVASGSTFLEISGKMLGNIEIAVPEKAEQDAIADYFECLDDLITLHQREYFKQQTEAKNVKYNQRDGPFL